MRTAHESSQLHLEGMVFGATAFKLCLHHFLVGRLEARDAPSPPRCPSVEQRRIKVVSSLGVGREGKFEDTVQRKAELRVGLSVAA